MWGWAKECNMTDKKAQRIMFKLYESKKLTENQLKNCRKTLSYAYELCGGDAKKNWPSIKQLFTKAFNLKSLPKGRACNSTKPTRIPTPEQLKRAFMKEWICLWVQIKGGPKASKAVSPARDQPWRTVAGFGVLWWAV